VSTRFPKGFVWGTATAAHQVEGGNWNNDWWAWEHTPGSPCQEPSGDACDHWHRWPDDVALVADLGFGAYRFSLEWSRIEPEEGEWSSVALDHYRAMCLGCRERGIEPIVTFHHFTTPRWLAAKGGLGRRPRRRDAFARFCARAAAHLRDAMGRACTINEPNIVATFGHLHGVFPPGKRDADLRRRANDVFVAAHRRGVDAIRGAAPGVPVGLTLAMSDYQAVDGGEAARDCERRDMEDVFLAATGGDDFVGVQTYTRLRVGPDGLRSPEPGVPAHADGLRVLARGARGDDPPRLGGDGRPRAHPRHRERHRHRRRRRARPLRRACPARRRLVPGRRDRRPRLRALEPSSTTSSGPSAMGRPSGSSPSTGRRRRGCRSRARDGSAPSHGRTRCPEGRMALRLYASSLSPFARKVKITLYEKGAAFDAIEIERGAQRAELLAINPRGEVPALVDGETVVAGSSLICDYLEDVIPRPALLPSTAGPPRALPGA
jgi:beta-glucosidase